MSCSIYKKDIIIIVLFTHYLTIEQLDVRASLLKAMMVHSGTPTEGYVEGSSYHFYYKVHYPYEGFGRIQLENVLRFDESPFELFLYYGQVNKKKNSFSIDIPLTISFLL